MKNDHDPFPIQKRLMKLTTILLLTLALHANAQSSTNDWLTLSGGGGAASSANYILNDTLGQPAVGTIRITSANYTIIGGFWAVENMDPEPGRPELHVSYVSATTVKIWWPSSSTGFVLEVNTTVNNPSGWGTLPAGTVVTDDGTTRSVIVSSVFSPRFYRLRKN